MKRTAWALLALVLLAGSPLGCVTRRYVITSDPPGAVVYRDGQYLGPTPVEEQFVFYGKYRFRLVKDNYQIMDVEPELVPPWYQWTGIDFVAENLSLLTFRDVQVLHFKLTPAEIVRPDDVKNRGETLRERGRTLPAEPPPQRAPAPVPPPPRPAPVSVTAPPAGPPPPTAVINAPSPSPSPSAP